MMLFIDPGIGCFIRCVCVCVYVHTDIYNRCHLLQ